MPVSEGLIHSRDPRARSSGLHPAAFAPHVVPGSIMWLPPRAELPANFEIDDGCYDHPVVVLSIRPLNGKVVFMLLTSLRGMDLAERHPHKPSVRCAHLPIDPSKPHPDNHILLKLDDGSPMLRKKSYVKTEKQYTIGHKLLTKYDRRSPHNYFLSKASYKTLVEYVQFSESTPLPQNLLLCGFTNTSNGQVHSSVHRSASIGSSRVMSAVDASPSTPLLGEHSPSQRLPGNPQPWAGIPVPYGKYPYGLQIPRDARFSSYGSISGRMAPVPRINYHGYRCQCRQCGRHNVSSTENHGDGKFCGLNGSQWAKLILWLCALGVFFYGAYRVYCGLVTALGWLRGCWNWLRLHLFSVVIGLIF